MRIQSCTKKYKVSYQGDIEGNYNNVINNIDMKCILKLA